MQSGLGWNTLVRVEFCVGNENLPWEKNRVWQEKGNFICTGSLPHDFDMVIVKDQAERCGNLIAAMETKFSMGFFLSNLPNEFT
mmetsp:Transcript_23228/g.54806  ORF Transcript_23228/g.54806 Transcript_23228/m.54806 type:complete len:84 (-) Transcript_23228:40-291(-)